MFIGHPRSTTNFKLDNKGRKGYLATLCSSKNDPRCGSNKKTLKCSKPLIKQQHGPCTMLPERKKKRVCIVQCFPKKTMRGIKDDKEVKDGPRRLDRSRSRSVGVFVVLNDDRHVGSWMARELDTFQ